MSDPERIERFRRLYEPAYPRMLAYVRRRARTVDDTHDVVAEVFLTAWRRLDDAPEEAAWMGWLYGIARRVLANHYRSDDRRRRLVDRLGAVTPPVLPGDDEGPEVVRVALGRLSPDDQEILTLSAWDGLENAEIAVALGMRPATVAVRLHRARRRLGRELGRLGYAGNGVKSAAPTRTPPGVKGTDPDEETAT